MISMTAHLPSWLRRPVTVALIAVIVLSTPTAAAAERFPGDLRAATPVAPAGITTVIEGAAWSWFEDERVTFAGKGTRLLASAVAGSTALAPPGTVLLADVDLASGGRRLVDLGQAESDDHNSAAIYESSSGEITTAWSRHHQDSQVRMQRLRTDGTWLRLPPTDIKRATTYNNLRTSSDAAGKPVLYDFLRGTRFDPEVIASADSGRTWSRLGRVLRDSMDSAIRRPYVQYSRSVNGRIHFVATDGHPRDVQTGVYHGYIEAGKVYNSKGTLLGPLGSAIPVTELTPIWLPTGVERGWTSDIVVDPSSGRPTVVFSVRTGDDRRYMYARWSGSSWQVETLAAAGRALYVAEADYTGLVALDPSDPSHVVASVDTSPTSGQPLVSASDGQRHWELWDGRRSATGGWTWTALTADSTVDNLRPVLANDPSGARALLWMRGTYRAYTDYSVDVVGVITRADGSEVAATAATWAPTTDVLPTPTPRPERAQPVVGAFDGHPADDLLMVRAGSAPDDLFLGDDQRQATAVAGPSITSAATPVAGDYNGDGRTDIYWYAPGTAIDRLWTSTGAARFSATTPRQAAGTYTPIPGDFNGDGRTDIYWYAPGSATDSLWTATAAGFTPTTTRQSTGTFAPATGDFDGDGRADILWYAPNGATSTLWYGRADGTFDAVIAPRTYGNYTPVAGDFNGDHRTDILWYASGSRTEYLWMAAQGRRFTTTAARQVVSTFTPIVADLDGDGADDIQWYAPGGTADQVWWSANGPLAATETAKVNL